MHRSFNIDRERVVNDALSKGVSPLIITGTSEESSLEASKYARKYPGLLYNTVGIHPHDAKSYTSQTIETFRCLAKEDFVVAIGECGLDYNRDFSPRKIQRDCFEAHINLAIETELPLFLHERDSFEDFVSILRNARKDISNAVVHCFTGTRRQLEIYLDLDCHIGITGWICDERRGKHLIDLINIIPSNRLMIETDAPFLLPRSMKNSPIDGRNEPKFLIHILEEISQYLYRDIEDIADEIYQTSCQFFRLNKSN